MQDATVQSTPQMSQPSVAPSSYVAAAPQPTVPVQASQAGVAYPQASTPQAPQAVPNYQSAPSAFVPPSQAAAPQANPWESAFSQVVGLLGQQASPSQAAPSPVQAPVASPYTQGNWESQAPVSYPQTQPNSVPQTWQTSQTSSPNYSQTSSVSSLADVADLLEWSPESRMVVANYGTEAPAILNQYALNLEGMLDSAVAWGQSATRTLMGYANFAVGEHKENLAYNEILTNPDVLSDYTLQFFGPQGPCPVYESEAELETRGYPTAPVGQQGQVVPGLPAPPQAAAPQQPQDFWGAFKAQMDYDPTQAWRIVNQADPRVMANKLFVME